MYVVIATISGEIQIYARDPETHGHPPRAKNYGYATDTATIKNGQQVLYRY